MNDTFCPLPWLFQAVRNNGDIRICCQANMTANKGVVRHADGRAYNIAQDDLSQARNADLMKVVRKNMLEGIWSEECARCKTEEENGFNSRRQYERKNWPSLTLDDAKRLTDADGSIHVEQSPVEYLDIRFGNFCNLACVMCGPADSHTWYEDHVAVTGDMSFTDTHGKVELFRDNKGRVQDDGAYRWFENDDLLDKFDVSSLKHIYMAGGEPLLIKMHYRFLEELVRRGYAENIVLEYNTNLTTVPTKAVDLWRSFKQVRLGVSIDGIGDVFEYHRWPARWSAVEDNLQKLDRLDNVNYWFAVTVTAISVWGLPELMRYCLDAKLDKLRKVPSVHVAHRPLVTNVRLLPAEKKAEIERLFTAFMSTLGDSDKEALVEKRLRSVMDYMNGGTLVDQIPRFKSYINTLEKRRGNDLKRMVPQLASLW